MRVLRYKDHILSYKMAEELIELMSNPTINESMDDYDINKILKGLSKDLKFNYGLVLTFGTGIKSIYPIVENLIKNGNLKIEFTNESILLLTITAVAITYLEENNNKSGESYLRCQCNGKDAECERCDGNGKLKSLVSKDDTQTLLEELKLRGIGNGVVKKLVSCFKSIGNVLKTLFKKTQYIIKGFVDMFAYTSILLPTMNAISMLVGNYKFNIDTLSSNFLSLGIGISSLLAKHGFNYITNKMQVKSPSKTFAIKDGDTNISDDLIKEQ